ncbi:(4Fe-4S)-binding protein [Thermoplasmatales archaeon SG8-52-4]|nr:MAG: (4Fe-4S)-binding protein [Thermoplasmatales archaeon SG8-52-4]
MKQLTIISGKGGTGKTSIAAAFASITKNAVFADCDVDAADLHLILNPKIKKTMNFHGLKIASINRNVCTICKNCYEHCRFNAIDKKINIIKESCEGCGVCEYVCPVDAIQMVDRDSGYFYTSETRFGPMAHAKLKTAEEASGKLVTVVKNNANKLAEEKKKDLVVIDGPPGIGCPVISAISGVDLVLVVTEPALSAIHDLERILGVAHHFQIPAVVCINKYDINMYNTGKIDNYCKNNNIDIVGKLPYDNIVTEAMIREETVVEYSKGDFSNIIIDMWKKIGERLKK